MRELLCYVSPTLRNKIEGWYFDLLPKEQADADEFIKNMRKSQNWVYPDFKWLGNGLGEFRWKSENKQHRLIGFFYNGIFALLIGCTHKQRRYDPTDALDTADRRRKLIISGKATVCLYDI